MALSLHSQIRSSLDTGVVWSATTMTALLVFESELSQFHDYFLHQNTI